MSCESHGTFINIYIYSIHCLLAGPFVFLSDYFEYYSFVFEVTLSMHAPKFSQHTCPTPTCLLAYPVKAITNIVISFEHHHIRVGSLAVSGGTWKI